MRKRVLLDENLPHNLRILIVGHEVFTVAYMRWIGLKNGDLLTAAENAKFDVFVTSDQGFPRQQNMAGRKVAILLVPTPDWNVLKNEIPRINAAIKTAAPGVFTRLTFSD